MAAAHHPTAPPVFTIKIHSKSQYLAVGAVTVA